MKKMKWNWGTGIVFVMLGFISFILYFVITMSTNKKYNHDLVTEDYYAKEMAYQNEIDAESNTHNLIENIESKKVPNGWLIRFPQEFETSKIKGTIALYRPSNKQYDFELPLVFKNHELHIPNNILIDGRWNITMKWVYQDKVFMYKEKIMY